MMPFYYYHQNPPGLCFLVQIRSIRPLILAGITRFKSERKNVRDSGRNSKMTPSCKWPIDGTEKPNIPSKFVIRAARYNEFRCK